MTANPLNQYRRELRGTLAGFLPAVPDTRLRHIVKCVTAGWDVAKRTDLHLTDDDRIIEVADPMDASLPDDVTRYRALWTITTAPRPLDRDEQFTKRELLAARDWVHGTAEYRKATPPPRGVPVYSLLKQRKWWLFPGREAVRVKDLDPVDRAALLTGLAEVAYKIEETAGIERMVEHPMYQRLCKLVAKDVRRVQRRAGRES